MKLHFHPLSTYTRRVVIALTEKQIAYESILIDMAARKHREAEYLALNPYGRVPALEHDGIVLYESTAILNYLEALHPEPALLPASARQRALVDMHMKLCDLQFTPHVGTIIFPKRFLPPARWDLAAMAAAKTQIEKHLVILAGQLKDKSYLVDETFTLADLCYLPFLEFLPLMEIDPAPSVADWAARLLGRASAQATKPQL